MASNNTASVEDQVRKANVWCVISGIPMLLFQAAVIIGLNSHSFSFFNLVTTTGSTIWFLSCCGRRKEAIHTARRARHDLSDGRPPSPTIKQRAQAAWPLTAALVGPVVLVGLLVASALVDASKGPDPSQALAASVSSACEQTLDSAPSHVKGPRANGVIAVDGEIVAAHRMPLARSRAVKTSRDLEFASMVLGPDDQVVPLLTLCFATPEYRESTCSDLFVELRETRTGALWDSANLPVAHYCSAQFDTWHDLEFDLSQTRGELRTILEAFFG